MKRKILCSCVAILGMFTSTVTKGQTFDKNYMDGKVFFELKEDKMLFMPTDKKNRVNLDQVTFLNQLVSKYKITQVIHKFPNCKNNDLRKVYEVNFTNYSGVENLIRDLSQYSFIKFAEKEMLNRIFYSPSDTIYQGNNQWALAKINAEQAWDISKGSSSIIVAVVDNAMWTGHPDLSAKFIAGQDVSDNDADPNPPAQNAYWDHGTFTSGVAGAQTDNVTGIASIGFNISIMPVKATPDTASNPTIIHDGYAGILWAAENGARVISLSWGGNAYLGTVEQTVLDYAIGLGCTIVAAAGNTGVNTPIYPAAYSPVIAVASTGKTDVMSSFSAYGTWIDVAAPGESIISTITNHIGTNSAVLNYDYNLGTSTSCPLVAGLCGLMLSVNPYITQAQLEGCLKSGCDNINAQNPSYIGWMGSGRINALASMECVSAISTPPIPDFTGAPTTIAPGGSVDFTDKSGNGPTSWSWSFDGGTPATSTSQNPTGIVFTAPGCHDVTLTATNSYGTKSVTKTCYVNVIIAACDTITNFHKGIDNIAIYTVAKTSTTWGYVTGTNSYDDNANADYFASAPPSGYKVSGLGIALYKAYAGSASSTIDVKLWDNSTNKPSTVLATKTVKLNTLTAGAYNFINFDVPVAVTGSYYAGFTFNGNGSPMDTVVVVSNQNGQSNPTTAWCLVGTTWYDYKSAFGAYISQGFFPVLCNGTTGIEESVLSNEMNVYPNPTTGELNIQFATGFNENINVSIYNTLGAMISKANQSDIRNGSIKLDLSAQPSGIYLVESRTNDAVSFKKVVLTK